MLDTAIIKKKNYLYNNLSNVFCIYLIKFKMTIFVQAQNIFKNQDKLRKLRLYRQRILFSL